MSKLINVYFVTFTVTEPFFSSRLSCLHCTTIFKFSKMLCNLKIIIFSYVRNMNRKTCMASELTKYALLHSILQNSRVAAIPLCMLYFLIFPYNFKGQFWIKWGPNFTSMCVPTFIMHMYLLYIHVSVYVWYPKQCLQEYQESLVLKWEKLMVEER